MGKLRALGVVRISVGNEHQTGPETQKTRITKRVDADEAELVGFAEDVDVSASISPWMRPQLGDWINNRAHEFDVLYVFKIDRIARSSRDLSDLIDWCEKHGKGFISCEEGFDLSKPWGVVIAKILSVLAEAELKTIQERIRASRETMRKSGRWAGGLVPFGRKAVKGDSGYGLELDPEFGPYLVEMIRRFTAAEKPSFSTIADWLNEEGVPTTQDIARMRAAAGESTTRLSDEKKAPRGSKWTPTAVQAILVSRSLLGEYQRADESIVRNEDGTPVMRSVPVLTAEEFERLQHKVQSVKHQRQKGSTSPLVGVAFCAKCQQPLYYVKDTPTRSRESRYRCQGNKSKGIKACARQATPAEEMHEILTTFITETIGHLDVMESVTRFDDRREAQLAVIDGQMAQYTKELQAGKLNAIAYGSLMAEAAKERERIAESDGPKPETIWTSTGQTYAEWWKASEPDDRREFLQRHGVRIMFLREPQRLFLVHLGDLMDNLKAQGLTPPEAPRRLLPHVIDALGVSPETYFKELEEPTDPRLAPTNYVFLRNT
ncbi:recombinase family protein [Streptomyces guryensis]|uniref:Recombinase family protein n=1 Tax=Streptomyces guryensis TaxID=2886947 RepID=A0A9Q3Z583_9ACTN|nr:recombinase family protein [Streptomyces guryensis]MCD9873809.1 recombinase family protein [Streptomyces guryensis]